MNGRLSGKVALVTGAASGIGLATAHRFAEQGATVVVADVNVAAAEAAVAGNDALHATALDVTDEVRWTQVVDETLERFGRLDALVNNAGIGSMRDIEQCTTEEWRRTFAVNADGVFFGCREGVRAMKSHGGSIVNISSVSGLIGGRNLVAYNASKGAVRLLTKSVALHCAHRKYGIRCNSVHPTFIETPMVEAMLQATRDPTQTLATLKASIPLGRLGQADEIADLLVYLVSDESQFCTGAEFVIDGGMTAS
jgi:NAD(P)-dependent dehydrogenase (short-subunit alcohol dehydrogenase family)